MFKVTIEKFNGEEIHTMSLPTKKEAKKYRGDVMKLNGMVKHAGRFVNYSDGIELFTNF